MLREGFLKMKEQTIFQNTENKEFPIITLSKEPLIVVLENFLSDGECESLINLSKERLTRSKVGVTHIENEMRTSSGMFFDESENEMVKKIEKRASKIMSIPIEHAENLQILHYKIGQEYKPHFDFFASSSVMNNRISTIIMYLNDVEEGGETFFPLLNISITPKKGTAVYFEYFYNDPELNNLTLHCGSSVKRGEKWVATQWMRRKKIRK